MLTVVVTMHLIFFPYPVAWEQCAMASVSKGVHTYSSEIETDGVVCYLASPAVSPHLALRAVAGSPQVFWSSQVEKLANVFNCPRIFSHNITPLSLSSYENKQIS